MNTILSAKQQPRPLSLPLYLSKVPGQVSMTPGLTKPEGFNWSKDMSSGFDKACSLKKSKVSPLGWLKRILGIVLDKIGQGFDGYPVHDT